MSAYHGLKMVVTALCSALILQCQNECSAKSTLVLHGSAASDIEVENLEVNGVKCVVQEANARTLVVDVVRFGSSAFYKGLQKGDVISSVVAKADGVTVDFRRNNQVYRVFLKSQNKGAPINPNNADSYLLSLEQQIQSQQAKRQVLIQEEAEASKNDAEEKRKSRINTSTTKVGERFNIDKSKIRATAIKQGHVPNCWFEASLAAVAETKDGHKLIGDLILKTSEQTYRVTFPVQAFPGDCKWVDVTLDDLANYDLPDKALWARILDCACQKRYPFPVNGKTGLQILTGKPTVFFSPSSDYQISETLQRITAQDFPAIMGTRTDRPSTQLPGWHAFSLVAYDKGSGVATLRDPMGGDPLYFQKLDLTKVVPITDNAGVRLLGDGLLQVNIRAIAENFDGIVWAETK